MVEIAPTLLYGRNCIDLWSGSKGPLFKYISIILYFCNVFNFLYYLTLVYFNRGHQKEFKVWENKKLCDPERKLNNIIDYDESTRLVNIISFSPPINDDNCLNLTKLHP